MKVADAGSVRDTAMAERRVAQLTHAVADAQRARTAALRELAAAYVAQADAGGEAFLRSHAEWGRSVYRA